MLKFKIAVAQNRYDKKCINTEFDWNSFLSRISTPIRTIETYEQFMSFSKSKQDNLKDVGGFIAGESKDGRRQATSIINRCMVVLDADNIEPRINTKNNKLCRWNELYICFIFYKKAQFIQTPSKNYYPH